MNEFQSFLLVLCPICFFTGIGNSTLALTHWQITVPLTLSVWKYDIDQLIFLSGALDFFSSPLSIALLRYLFGKKGIKLIIPKFINTFVFVAIVSSIVGWLIRGYTLKYLSMVFGTGISWALLFFFVVFALKTFREIQRTREERSLAAEKKKKVISRVGCSSDPENLPLNDLKINDQDEFLSQLSRDDAKAETADSSSKVSNGSDDRASPGSLLHNGDEKQDQKKMILEEELKPWAGDFQNKQFKNAFTIFALFLIPIYVFGGVLGVGPGLFLGVLLTRFFGFGPLNASVVANLLMELLMIVLGFGYLIQNKIDYSFFLPRFFSLLPCSLAGVTIGSIYSVKIPKLKVFIVNTAIFFIGFAISVIVYLIKNK
ncbi:membrane transporter protein [Anaeramoeba flamelloides]|uniref:Membrane transporter protein n=1 Tax=Anaeramoeba flamelloides TaxID=1746091 RepID=A0AAV7ZJJ9_9EUKA|nr:membrane transporter protein [Anaeramoeba flamelloides]